MFSQQQNISNEHYWTKLNCNSIISNSWFELQYFHIIQHFKVQIFLYPDIFIRQQNIIQHSIISNSWFKLQYFHISQHLNISNISLSWISYNKTFVTSTHCCYIGRLLLVLVKLLMFKTLWFSFLIPPNWST